MVPLDGFEPTTHGTSHRRYYQTELQRHMRFVVPRVGLEPTQVGLRGRYATLTLPGGVSSFRLIMLRIKFDPSQTNALCADIMSTKFNPGVGFEPTDGLPEAGN